MAVTLLKRLEESPRVYSFNYSKFPEVRNGETILSVVSITVDVNGVPAPELVIGAPSILGNFVSAPISGGFEGVTYRVLCTVTTSGGNNLTVVGMLLVSDEY